MEAFPKIDLFPRLTKVGEFVASLVKHLPDCGYPSDHNSGGGPMLDRELPASRSVPPANPDRDL